MSEQHRGRGERAQRRVRMCAIGSVVIAMLVVASCTDGPGGASSSTAATLPAETGHDGGAGAASSAPGTTAGSPPSAVEPTTSTIIAPTTTAATTTTTTTPPTTTTTIPLVTGGAIVLVANATKVPGAAGQLTSALQAVGFSVKEATDAAGYEERLDASKIYFLPAAEAAAQSLALVMQINSVSRMPTPAPVVDAQVGLGDATVLIMLGKDLAGKEIPGLAGR